MTGFHTKPLNESTWPDTAGLAAKHNRYGVAAGVCPSASKAGGGSGPRRRTGWSGNAGVMAGQAHAAPVYDGIGTAPQQRVMGMSPRFP